MYKSLLIPIADDDDPARTDRALAVASALGEADAKLVLLHVVEAVPAYVMTYIPEDLRERSHKEATDMLAAVASRADRTVLTVVKGGHGGQTIVEYAEEIGSDCIVISSHRPEFQDVFFGSTAAHVVRHAASSVHVLR